MIFYCGLMVHITATRAQKVVSYSSEHITETVFAHDQHLGAKQIILSTAVSSFAKAQKMDNHTVAWLVQYICSLADNTLVHARLFTTT